MNERSCSACELPNSLMSTGVDGVLSQNDNACILLSGLWGCAWLNVCSLLNHIPFSCREGAAEFVLCVSTIGKQDKVLAPVHFTFPSSGACASSKCTSLVKNTVDFSL